VPRHLKRPLFERLDPPRGSTNAASRPGRFQEGDHGCRP
jgi:hypothetical protein